MKGGKNRQPLGYTIIEVMIVLAVSGLMFLIAADFISGKQARTSFTAGTNQTASDIQDVIEQVNDGKFSDIPLYCNASSTSLNISAVGPGSPDCTFLGKFLHFPYPSLATQYETFSLAGAREINGNPPTSLDSDLVTAIISPDLTTQETTSQNLTVKDIQVTSPGFSGTVYGIGFVQSLGSTDGGSYISGAQTVELEYAPNLAVGDTTEAQAAAQLSNLQPASTAAICLTDGQRYAQIVLGATNGNPLSASVQVETTC